MDIIIDLTPLCFVAFIVFLILKLAGVIAWSWWLVCLPILIPIGFVLISLLVVLCVCVFVAFIIFLATIIRIFTK